MPHRKSSVLPALEKHYVSSTPHEPIADFACQHRTAELEPITDSYVQSDEVDMGMSYAELSVYGNLVCLIPFLTSCVYLTAAAQTAKAGPVRHVVEIGACLERQTFPERSLRQSPMVLVRYPGIDPDRKVFPGS